MTDRSPIVRSLAQPTIRGLMLARAADDGPGLRMDDDRRSWREVVDASRAQVGVLMAQPDLSPAWWSGEGTWVREGDTYRPRTDDDIRPARAFEAAGRAHLRPGGSP